MARATLVLIIDNTSFYSIYWIEQIYYYDRVNITYLPLYSADLNPIEEHLAELKALLNGTGRSTRKF
jgi:transposase